MKRSLSVAAKAIVTVLLLILVFRAIPLSRVFEALRGASLPWFVAGLLVGLLSLWASALRLKCLTDLQGMSISVPGHLAIHLSASFYGLFLPGLLAGSVLRWHRMFAPGRNAAGALVVVLLNRLIATTATAGVGVVLWSFARRGGGHVVAGGLGVLAVFLGLVALQAGLLHPAATAAMERVLDGGLRVPGLVRRGFRQIVLAIAQYRRLTRAQVLRIVSLALAEEAFGIATFVLFARSVGLAVTPVELGWVRSFVNLATTVPVSIAGLGVREGSFVVLLAPYGVAGGDAVALSTLVLARSILLGVAGGLVDAGRFLAGRGRR